MNKIPSAAIGRIGIQTVRSYDVTEKDIKRFAQAIDDPNFLWGRTKQTY
ncbi:hypothetical protein [Desulfosarcina ovata]|nr:hypothetical protein [Desulfosarcina ovata]